MAIKKYRLIRNGSGGEDRIYLETSSDMVVHDSTTVAAEINSMKNSINNKANSSALSGYVPTSRKVGGKALTGDVTLAASDVGAAAISHNHNMADFNAGVLPVEKGGTGFATLEELKAALGDIKVTPPTTGDSFDVANSTLGQTVKWANVEWIVVHVDGNIRYLARKVIESTTQFHASSNVYKTSTLASVAATYESKIPADSLAIAVDTTVNGVTSKIFVASYEQMNGGFKYFDSNAKRICQYNSQNYPYWTSSPYPGSSIGAWGVSSDGGLYYYGVNYTYGFRPFVAINVPS